MMKKTNYLKVGLLGLMSTLGWSNGNAHIETYQTPPVGETFHVPAAEDKNWQVHISAGWLSKYVTEGLDCLPGSGIWEFAPSVSYEKLTLSTWYANGVDENYDELDVVLGYSWELDRLTINPWYEHQFYLSQDTNVANPALTLSYQTTNWMTVGAETQVKLEHQNFESYYSAFVRMEWEPCEKVLVSPIIRYGYNGGYNIDYGDGSNSIDWGLDITWKVTKRFAVVGTVNYSQALTVLRRKDAGDEFWFGCRCVYEF